MIESGSSELDIVLIGLEQEENLGLRSIAAYLETHGLKVEIKPYVRTGKKEILKQALEINPKILGFSLIFQGMFPEFVDLIKYLRANGVKSHFTMGGHLATIEYEKVMESIPEIDTIVRHEGEITLLELYKNLENPQLWPKIKGLAYRRNGKIEATSPRPLIENLDSLPFPTRRKAMDMFRNMGICSIQASRGCFFNCSYCSINQFYSNVPGSKRRSRSPKNVAEEMEILFKRGARFFKFIDDDLGMRSKAQKDWMRQFADELKKRRIADNILWRISVRVDELDAAVLRMVKEAGMDFVFLGIEAGCEQSLKTFNKGYNVEDIWRGVSILDQVGVEFEYGFMLFDPECSFDTVRENFVFLSELCKDGRVPIHFTKVFPYVGTYIARKLQQEGRLTGSLAAPNYNYHDKRMQMLEAVVYKGFHNAFFGPSGISGRLQMLKFDGKVLEKFFTGQFDLEDYSNRIKQLTQRYNDSALETLNLALDFIEMHSYEEILQYWWIIENLVKEELAVQSKICALLTRLKATHNVNYLKTREKSLRYTI
jgi:anaerobic magnesium-protoporphyrin IX monomethyl ester cyclase